MVARCHDVHLVRAEQVMRLLQPHRQIAEVQVYRKIRIVRGSGGSGGGGLLSSSLLEHAVHEGRGRGATHIAVGVRRQSGAVGSRGRGIRRGVVRGEVLAGVAAVRVAVAAVRSGASCSGASRTAAGAALRAPQALGQPRVTPDELAVLLADLQHNPNTPPSRYVIYVNGIIC